MNYKTLEKMLNDLFIYIVDPIRITVPYLLFHGSGIDYSKRNICLLRNIDIFVKECEPYSRLKYKCTDYCITTLQHSASLLALYKAEDEGT